MRLEEASSKMGISADELRAFCERWAIERASLFGSILRRDYSASSDIDLLVTFRAGTQRSLLDLIGAKQELEELTGRKVDLIERAAVERSENPGRRAEILNTALLIYEQG